MPGIHLADKCNGNPLMGSGGLMLSIGTAIHSLDELAALSDKLSHAYRGLMRDVRQYSVEVDAAATAQYHASLDAILERLGAIPLTGTDFQLIGSLFRGAQREYKTQAERSLRSLREQLEETAGALGDLVVTL